MTEFEKFIAQAERAFGRKTAAEAARIWRERGPEAARRFLASFDCFPAKRERPGRAQGCGNPPGRRLG
jgi:hypothetical protein